MRSKKIILDTNLWISFLISKKLDSKADYLITGDSDLLVMKNIRKTKIMNWTDFIEDME
ncbi:MAG: hypothetical protein Q8O72_10755 [Bacteroidales bacterium]|nr:hypothetical protein [Bacteroidales bacterium]